MTTAAAIDADEIEGRYAPVGEYTASFETSKQDVDPAPYFVGLPDDRCQYAGQALREVQFADEAVDRAQRVGPRTAGGHDLRSVSALRRLVSGATVRVVGLTRDWGAASSGR